MIDFASNVVAVGGATFSLARNRFGPSDGTRDASMFRGNVIIAHGGYGRPGNALGGASFVSIVSNTLNVDVQAPGGQVSGIAPKYDETCVAEAAVSNVSDNAAGAKLRGIERGGGAHGSAALVTYVSVSKLPPPMSMSALKVTGAGSRYLISNNRIAVTTDTPADTQAAALVNGQVLTMEHFSGIDVLHGTQEIASGAAVLCSGNAINGTLLPVVSLFSGIRFGGADASVGLSAGGSFTVSANSVTFSSLDLPQSAGIALELAAGSGAAFAVGPWWARQLSFELRATARTFPESRGCSPRRP